MKIILFGCVASVFFTTLIAGFAWVVAMLGVNLALASVILYISIAIMYAKLYKDGRFK